MNNSDHFFQLNVGFITQQSVGYSRDFYIENAQIQLDPGLVLRDLNGKLTISRTSEGLLAQVNTRASTAAVCGRCLREFSQRLEIDFAELFTFANHQESDTEFVLPDDGIINFAPLVREYMLLELPISPICDPDCKGLCSECGGNLNEESCGHKQETVDSRMEVLKQLLDEGE